MASLTQINKVWKIEGPGTLIVTSDLHGNLEDFYRLKEIFEAEEDAVLLSLGDLFHGPKPLPKEWVNHYLYQGRYYEDQSVELFFEWKSLQEAHPNRVGVLLGNHEHAHIGGPLVRKFHPNESAFFESNLTQEEREALHEFLLGFAAIATSSCGLAFSHGAPPPTFFDRETLQRLNYASYTNSSISQMQIGDLLGGLLWRRTASEEDILQFLAHLNDIGDYPYVSAVVFGHDPSEQGYSIENNHLLNLSTSFWTLRENKKYLRVDLSENFYCTQ
ncbi:MAG: metallophosphoesterase, partial [Myxococcota bacterium]|nr:metallophosphoesterase [Myxococcota bacterium]